jgi:hypothetical protein
LSESIHYALYHLEMETLVFAVVSVQSSTPVYATVTASSARRGTAEPRFKSTTNNPRARF